VRSKFVAVILALLALAAGPALAQGHPGTLIIEGGGASSPEALHRMAALVGAGKRLCAITTANPGPSAIVGEFTPLGLDARAIKVTAANAASPDVVATLHACDGYYFDGGLPRLLSDAFLVNGKDTPALTTIRARFQAGAPIAGSSAGAIILGDPALCTCAQEMSSKVLHGTPPEISHGFGFVRLPIDAHVFTRNLYGRELRVMDDRHWPVLLAVDEGAAVEVPGDGGPWRVLGDATVAVIKAPARPGKPLTNYDISFLRGGDLIDPATLEPLTTSRKPVTTGHDGLQELVQVGPEALPQMASFIAGGGAEIYGWDSVWDPNAPERIRLALNDDSRIFENTRSPDRALALISHLTLSVQMLGRPLLLQAVINADERLAQDWGTPPHEGPRRDCVYGATTPIAAPGVTPVDKAGFVRQAAAGLAINAMPIGEGGKTLSIPGSKWLSGAGLCGVASDAVSQRLATRLTSLTQGDLDRPLVFYCASELCWHSYNAAQRARLLGYKRVYWYRGGLHDWTREGGATETVGGDLW
jgi:rhodanese-related sulfurtransferase